MPRLADANERQFHEAVRTWSERLVCCTYALRAPSRSRRATQGARRGPRASRARRGRERGRGRPAAGYARAPTHHAHRRALAHVHIRRHERALFLILSQHPSHNDITYRFALIF